MKTSWKIGRIAGIELKIHPTFLLLLVWVGLSTIISGGKASEMILDILLVLTLFFVIILHELGHALTARAFGLQTRDITLLPIGGIARLEKMPEDPKEEFLVAAAGPAVNLVIGVGLLISLFISGFFNSPIDIYAMADNFWVQLMTLNMSLFFFNLIPAFPMDGGRVLRALLGLKMDRVKATRIAATIGRGFAILMGIAGFFLNPWLILTAVFVWWGAGAEAKSVEVQAGLKGLVVRDALITQFYQVEANETLANVFQLSIQTGQQNIPVLSNGRFLGIIQREDLLKGMERLGQRAPAYAAIGMEPEGLDPEMALTEAIKKFTNSRVLPVMEDGILIGLITPESIQQRMWLNQRRLTSDPQKPGENTESV